MKKIIIKHKTIQYPSASIMLDISRNEYERERERSNILDNKASFFVSVSVAVITIFIPIIPFSELITFYKNSNKIEIVVATIIMSFLVVAMIFFVLALYNLYKAFSIKKYKNVNIENLNDEDTLKIDNNQVERGLIEHYNTILDYNINVNNKKAKRISTGFKYCILSFSFLCLSTISLIILIGG